VSLLRIEHLCCAFGSLVVTNDLNLVVEEGERHVVIGPNGAGKTSLINQIGGQLPSTAGHIHIGEVDITGRSPEYVAAQGVARTFQRNNLFFNLTVAENLRLAVQIKRGSPRNCVTSAQNNARVNERVSELLARVNLDGRGDRPVRALSYGEQRQLEIGMALACEPRLLMLDEPTSGMSPAETEQIISLIRSLPRSIAVLMIEHDMNVVFSIADRVTVLTSGQVLASGSIDDIKANQRVREVYLGGAP